MNGRRALTCLTLLLLALSRPALGEGGPDPAAAVVTYGHTAAGELRGFVYKPQGAGPFPAVLWNHGSEKLPGWVPALGHFYSEHGFVFFIPHRHGHGRSPGDYIVDLQKGTSAQQAIALHERYNLDVQTAVAWLAQQPYVDPKRMVMSGLSYGGIQTVLSAEKGLGLRAFIPFAPGAMSWEHSPALGQRLLTAIRAAKAPVFLLQAQNDFSLGPSTVLGAELRRKGGANQAKVYPAFGTTREDGHGGFATQPGGIALWGPDVLAFIQGVLGPARAAADVGALFPPDKSTVDAVVRSAIHDEQIPVTIGLIGAAGSKVYGYGRVSAANPRVPDGKTVYEVGSVSKAFTGLLLAQMLQRGDVRLEDPLAKYLPAGVRAPGDGSAPITLLTLATHTSGLPRMSPGAKRAKKFKSNYSVDNFYSELPSIRLMSRPGTTFLYSNVGAGLLAHILASRSGLADFSALVAARITGPLGMKDTRVTWTNETWARAAHPPGPNATASTPNEYLLLDGGAGGIKSTVDDLLTLEAAALGLHGNAAFASTAAVAFTQRFAQNADNGIGLFWNLDLKNKLVSKDGKVNGYLAFLMLAPDRRTGVVICTTVGVKTRLGALARRLLALLEPKAAAAPPSEEADVEAGADEEE